MQADEFKLYDLRVEVVVDEDRTIQCNARVGGYFEVRGEIWHCVDLHAPALCMDPVVPRYRVYA